MITQGKWVARVDEYAVDVVEEKTGFGICDIGTRKSLKDANYPNEQADANAKLIASAPDLLNAIKYYFDVLDEVRGKDWSNKPDHVLKKMLDAVAKAEGRTA